MTLQGVKRKVVNVSDFRLSGRLLGKGNFARVEEAIHNVLNAKVAVKIIDIRQVKEKYVVRNLHREARIMSILNHPCIAALFQTMQLADNVYYLVTELVSGGDLCTFIIGQRYGKLEERPARVYARQFASALSHMHSFGIVHRDLKMENVILNSAQTQIKIVDFGLSNVWSSDNPLRTHCGSPEYAAPELFVAGKEYGPEVDLWSLGIIFYGMVVGQLPFVGGRKNQLSSQERRKRLVAQINKGLGTPQRQAIAPLSPEFRAMLNKLLTADPAKRITAKQLTVHPWITERGRKSVETHPFKHKLESQTQTKITERISKLFGIDQATVVAEICKNPYGRLGGMYNILAHKCLTESFTPELIVSTISANKTASPEKKSVVAKPTSAPPSKSQHTFYNQCVVLLNRVSKQQIAADKNTHASPSTVISKNVTKVSRPQTCPLQNNTSTAQTKNTETLPTKRSPVSAIKSAPVQKKHSEKITRNVVSSRQDKQSAIPGIKRPHTTGTIQKVPEARPLKRTSLPTAAPKVHTPSVQELQRRQVCINSAGRGDGSPAKRRSASASVQKLRTKNPLANDPIARSIAGYLSRNVPNHIFNVQMTRKQQR